MKISHITVWCKQHQTMYLQVTLTKLKEMINIDITIFLSNSFNSISSFKIFTKSIEFKLLQENMKCIQLMTSV